MNTSNIKNYKPKDFAELLGVSVKTLQRWNREGTLKANRTLTNRRYYTYNQYLLNHVAFLRFCIAKGIIVEQRTEDYGNHINIY